MKQLLINQPVDETTNCLHDLLKEDLTDETNA
jgi:hypothetical protein